MADIDSARRSVITDRLLLVNNCCNLGNNLIGTYVDGAKVTEALPNGTK